MLIVRASIDTQHPAQGFNGVLEAKNVDSVQSLFECGVNMAIAFFKMRFSSSSNTSASEVP